ncbi:SipW-dependent-type signal peptide-containing protein [Arthrobacter globiformis]|uniref:SipW-dependent-type signal peptide-containing protein n=1 Tax=Arthrobacter globiformis TaxID=1665 RepID=UPI00397D0FBF
MSTTEITPATTPPTADKSKRRKAKAILAGGLVLGIGAAVTLAAWNDSEFVFGDFKSGGFNVQGSTNGVDFAEHSTADDKENLSFSTNYDNLSANETVAAAYALRLDEKSTYAASVGAAEAVAGGDATTAGKMSYGIIKVDSIAACTPDATGTTIVAAGTAFGATPVVTPFVLAKPQEVNGTTAAGASTFVCIKVKADADLPQGKAVTATWKFVATSTP